jgi:hypothetical protein
MAGLPRHISNDFSDGWRHKAAATTFFNSLLKPGGFLSKVLSSKWIKLPVFALCLVPLGRLGWRALNHNAES